MNYFDFFGVKEAFYIHEADLKKKYYHNSRQYHPDFFTLENTKKQAEVLELSTINNEAYLTLSDFYKRMEYVLRLHHMIKEEGHNNLPNGFLMEMMDINEAVMELSMNFDDTEYQSTMQNITTMESDLLQSIEPNMKAFDEGDKTSDNLEAVKIFFLKRKYLLRIKNNLLSLHR